MYKLELMGLAVLAALAVSAAALGATRAEIPMSEPIEFPHAGIVLSVPAGFEFRQPAEQTDVMRAVATKAKQPAQAISLSAFAVGEEVTTKSFAASMLENLRNNLVIRHLKVLKETPMPVAKLEGLARSLSYTFRGEKTLSAGVCFIRELTSKSARICYLLRVEAREKHGDKLLPFFGQMVKSVRLTPVRRPIDVVISALGPSIKDFTRGYSLRPPDRWFARLTDGGVIAGQSDYLRGGLAMPQLQVAVQDVGLETNSKDCAKRWLNRGTLSARKSGLATEVLSEGQAELAGLEAYQFLLLQSPKAQATSNPATEPATKPAADEAMIIAQRTVCVDAPGGKRKSFSLVILCPGGDDKAAEAVIEKISRGFRLLSASKPARTRPAKTEGEK